MVESAESPATRQQAPKSVQQAVNLLRLQATIWALLAADAWVNLGIGLTSTSKAAVVGTIAMGLAGAAFAAAKFWLAYRLPRSTHRTRSVVIGVEAVMAGFAALVVSLLAITIFGLILSPPFIIGGIMSARVAQGLTKPPALDYFSTNQALSTRSTSPRARNGGTPAQYRGYLATA
jgi:hypothetical protein